MAFLVHILRLHFYTALGAPRFKEMKDSFVSYAIFLAIATAVSTIFWAFAKGHIGEHDAGVSEVLISLTYGFIPVVIAAIYSQFHKQAYTLIQSLYACVTVVAVVAAVVWFLGLVDEPSYSAFMTALAALWTLCFWHFGAQPKEVKARGYGLKDGEF